MSTEQTTPESVEGTDEQALAQAAGGAELAVSADEAAALGAALPTESPDSKKVPTAVLGATLPTESPDSKKVPTAVLGATLPTESPDSKKVPTAAS